MELPVDRAVASRKNNRVLEAYLSYMLEKQYRSATVRQSLRHQ